MNTRRVVSLTAMISFLVMVLTSIILYIVPQGRVAYWADWHLWGLTKEQWGAIHINTGFLFLIFLIWHLYFNWKPIVAYLKNKSRRLTLFTREFNLALGIVALCVLGTYVELPPFSTVLAVGDGFKDRAALKYGEPPYGHAELSTLKSFAGKVGLNAPEALAALQQAGFQVTAQSETLQEIARNNKVSPQQLYRAMQPAASPEARPTDTASLSLPETPEPGTGNLTLAQLFQRYNLEPHSVTQALNQAGIAAEPKMTLKEIADRNGTGPLEIYDAIRTAAAGK